MKAIAAIRTTIVVLLLLLFTGSLPAQQLPQTPIQATVTDPNGVPYAFGTGSASIVCPGNQQPTYNNSPLTRTITISGLDGFGKFSMTLWNLATTQPSGCAWTFSITAADGKTSFTTGQITTVTGNSLVDLSAAISAYAVPLPVTSLAQFLGMANTWTKAQTFGAGITGTGSIGSLTAPYGNLTGFPSACGANQFATKIGSTPGCAQVGYSQLSGLPTLPANTAAVSHQWLNSYNSGTGAFGQTQPAFSDISGTAGTPQIGTGTPASGTYVDGGTGAWTPLPGTALFVVGNGGFLTINTGSSSPTCATGTAGANCQLQTFATSRTLIRIDVLVTVAASGCTTNAVVGVKDLTSSTVLSSLTLTTSGYKDSGALSVSTTAGDIIGVGLLTAPSGCTGFPSFNSLSATFQ